MRHTARVHGLLVALLGLACVAAGMFVVFRPLELLADWLDERNISGDTLVYGGLWVLIVVALPLGLYLAT